MVFFIKRGKFVTIVIEIETNYSPQDLKLSRDEVSGKFKISSNNSNSCPLYCFIELVSGKKWANFLLFTGHNCSATTKESGYFLAIFPFCENFWPKCARQLAYFSLGVWSKILNGAHTFEIKILPLIISGRMQVILSLVKMTRELHFHCKC